VKASNSAAVSKRFWQILEQCQDLFGRQDAIQTLRCAAPRPFSLRPITETERTDSNGNLANDQNRLIHIQTP
jgi:hypothetical protein